MCKIGFAVRICVSYAKFIAACKPQNHDRLRVGSPIGSSPNTRAQSITRLQREYTISDVTKIDRLTLSSAENEGAKK